MISADTNVLARAILEDNGIQSKIAQSFLEHHTKMGSLYLSPFMLLELAWLLKSKGLSRHQIAPILEKLIQSSGVIVGQKSTLIAALHMYIKHNVSFADCLITADASITANAKTATFDIALQKTDSRCVSP